MNITFDREHEAVFEGQAAAVAEARRFVRRALAEVGGLPDGLVDDALTSVSELATNAVRHTRSGHRGGKFTVRVEVTDGHVHVEVIDQGSATTRPEVRLGGDVSGRVGGRGLWILTNLGVLMDAPDPEGPGWRVWVLLARPALLVGCDLPLTSTTTTGGGSR